MSPLKIIATTGLLLPLISMANTLPTASCQAIGADNNQQCQYNISQTETMYAQSAMPFALCSKALCTLDPKNPSLSTCTCPVFQGPSWQGASVGPKSYADSKPTYNSTQQLTTVTSNFAMANLPSFDTGATTCTYKQKTGWANCFGQRCDVKTVNGKLQATCQCPVTKTSAFISVGPNNESQCNKGSTSDKIWSAAPTTQGPTNGNILKYMYCTYFKKDC